MADLTRQPLSTRINRKFPRCLFAQQTNALEVDYNRQKTAKRLTSGFFDHYHCLHFSLGYFCAITVGLVKTFAVMTMKVDRDVCCVRKA